MSSAPTTDAGEAALLRACASAPTRLEARRVYGDWLSEQGRQAEAELVVLARDADALDACQRRRLRDVEAEVALAEAPLLAGVVPRGFEGAVGRERGLPRRLELRLADPFDHVSAPPSAALWRDFGREVARQPRWGAIRQLEIEDGNVYLDEPSLVGDATLAVLGARWVHELTLRGACIAFGEEGVAAADLRRLRRVRLEGLASPSEALWPALLAAPRLVRLDLPAAPDEPALRRALEPGTLRGLGCSALRLRGADLVALDGSRLDQLRLHQLHSSLHLRPLPTGLRQLELGLWSGEPGRLRTSLLEPIAQLPRLQALTLIGYSQDRDEALPLPLPAALRELRLTFRAHRFAPEALPPRLTTLELNGWDRPDELARLLGTAPASLRELRLDPRRDEVAPQPELLAAIAALPPLRALRLARVPLDTTSLAAITAAHPELESLELDGCPLSDEDAGPLFDLRQLHELSLRETSLSSSLLRELRRLPSAPLVWPERTRVFRRGE